MLALFGNISGLEVGLILMLAVMIFGSRLPEVAARVYTQFRKLREGIDRFRRDTGIDQEMREIQRNVRDAAWRKQIQMDLKAPEAEVMERDDIGMPAQNVPNRRAHTPQPAEDPLEEEAERTKQVGLTEDLIPGDDPAADPADPST